MSLHSILPELGEQSHDAWLQQALAAYAAEGVSIEVNFRELVPALRPGAERTTHLMHPYPAKLLPAIPYLFLRCPSIIAPGSRVLDPFCGSGTVLLEAVLAGYRADGADANPLARTIAAAKLTLADVTALRTALTAILAAAAEDVPPPDVVNIAHWYHQDVIARLAGLRAGILAQDDPDIRRFFEICLSATARKVSLADPRLSVPVKINPKRLSVYGAKGAEVVKRLEKLTGEQVAPIFRAIAEQNIDRMAKLRDAAPGAEPSNLFDDARLIGREDGYYDLVVTSPPYVGAQKYVRASSLGLGWLGLTPGGRLRDLERLNIGREHYAKSEYADPQETECDAANAVIASVRELNPLRAHIASNYLVEMKAAFTETARVTRKGGWLILISGQNLISGMCFDTPAYLETIATSLGFQTRARLVDDIRSRGLMTKRNRTAGIISQEVITVMQKP